MFVRTLGQSSLLGLDLGGGSYKRVRQYYVTIQHRVA